MIKFKTLKWSNLFSYGANNEIDFSEHSLLQLIGKNGHGKTSIILVLEEILFNKNSKGIPRGKVLNRYVSDKFYTIYLEFDKDDKTYCIETKRGATQTVKLLEDGVDISAHTPTGTYKLIEQILGMDHKTFTQIVNQLSSSSLEFLTATDGGRKKFLIDLLNLEKYSNAASIFKDSAKVVETSLNQVKAKIAATKDLIKRNKSVKIELMHPIIVPILPDEVQKLPELKFSLTNIEAQNKKILQNNKYAEVLAGLKVEPAGDKPQDNTASLTKAKTEAAKTSQDAQAFIKKMNSLGTKCATCLSEIDESRINSLICEHEKAKKDADAVVTAAEDSLKKLKSELATWSAKAANIKTYEEYHALYDPTLPKDVLDALSIKKEIDRLEKLKVSTELEIKAATSHNLTVSSNNAKLELLSDQTQELETELPPLEAEEVALQTKFNNLQVLIKTFSNTGLVAYKIECLIKDLEEMTNEYLQELSGGRFQLGFEVSSGDKLNVVITDNGNDIEINALSGGEKARVNVSTLLGIRKLLQSLSNNRVNLLFLDETIDSLDDDGKEKLVEVLLSEEGLNTVIVSHGFQHPLIEKLKIIKTKNISRIDNG